MLWTYQIVQSDVKTVNVWYQNKRRSMKKKLLKWTEAENSSASSRASSILAPKTHPMLRRNPSYTLDSIASRRERMDSRPPLRPRKHVANQAADGFDFSDNDWRPENIYDLIPSSPLQPPSSPAAECTLFSGLPPTSKMVRSLEFACAKDRADRRRRANMKKGLVDSDVEYEEEMHMDFDVPELYLDGGSDSEGEFMITPDTSLQSVMVSPRLLRTPSPKGKGKEKAGPVLHADEEAARALLAFRGA